MKDYSDFRADLEYGEEGEKILDSILTHQKIEVKRDRMAHRTQNYFIEYQSHGKPSGINTTTAQHWALMTADGSTTLLVQTTRLVEALQKFKADCIKANIEPDTTWAKPGGDGNTSIAFCIEAPALIGYLLECCKDR